MAASLTTELERNVARLTKEIKCLENRLHELGLVLVEMMRKEAVFLLIGDKIFRIQSKKESIEQKEQRYESGKDMIVSDRANDSKTTNEDGWVLRS